MFESFNIMFLVSLFLWLSVLIFLIFILVAIRGKAKIRRHKLTINNVKNKSNKAAMFIDADNTNCIFMDKIMENLEQIQGYSLVYSCLYGLPSSQKSWKKTATQYNIQQKTLTNYVEGKNSTDFSIVIDCMDLLLNEDIDLFILVSSDSDFSGIVYRLLQEGKTVVGMGKDQTPAIFRSACNQFFYLDDKSTSPSELKQVLEKLVTHYNGRIAYGKIKHIILNRFGLNMMGFNSFDQMLDAYGYYSTASGVILENHKRKKLK
ncbi:MAG: NYN domain-containing protein [Spirochaetales bacterium]